MFNERAAPSPMLTCASRPARREPSAPARCIQPATGDPRWRDVPGLAENQSLSRRNKSGHVGVRKRGNNYLARIGVGGKLISLGSFKTMDEAIAARRAAQRKFGFSDGHGSKRCVMRWLVQCLRDLVANRKTARPAAQPPVHPGSVELVTFRLRGAEIAASSNVNGRWRLRVMAPGS